MTQSTRGINMKFDFYEKSEQEQGNGLHHVMKAII